jgi:acetoin utilization deacetylase AcuC-like enzyme
MILIFKTISLFFLITTINSIMRTSNNLIKIPKAVFFYNDIYKVTLPPTHRFPMEKYYLVRSGLQEYFRDTTEVQFKESPLVTADELSSTHCRNYIDRYLSGSLTDMENRRIGFPWTTAGVKRSLSSVGGTVAATRAVCADACHIAGHLAGMSYKWRT